MYRYEVGVRGLGGFGDAHSLLVVGGSPGCDLSKDPCCDRRSSSRRGWDVWGV